MFKVLNLGLKAYGFGLRVQDVFWVQSLRFKVQGSGFRIWDLGFRLQGLGFRV